jgi:putative transposase
MQIGNRFRLYPNSAQQKMLSQWIGCQRFIYNAKVQEHALDSYFAYKTMQHINAHPPLDCTIAQFKSKELTPWLYDCPSQILRNGAYIWRQTMQGFLRGLNKKARRQHGHGELGVWLTSELFSFVPIVDTGTGEILGHKLMVGTKKHPVGAIVFVAHKTYKIPKSIHIKRNGSKWYLSFNYDDGDYEWTDADNIARLSQFSDEELAKAAIGVDRGVAIPFATSALGNFDYSDAQKKTLSKCDRYIRRHSRIAARRTQGGSNCKKAWQRVAKYHARIKDIRNDFAHQTSHAIASNPSVELIGFEKLNNTGMVKKPKAKQDACGKWIQNGARAKAGLSKAILGSVWGSVKDKTAYKARRLGKLVVEVKAAYSSQECSQCGTIHAENRQAQALFSCLHCGHTENADTNASKVIAKRAITLLRAGIKRKEKKSRGIRRKLSITVGVDTSEPLVATSETPMETVLDGATANAVVAQSSLKWETATIRPRL